MMKFAIKPGATVAVKGRAYRVLERVDLENVLAESVETGEVKTIAIAGVKPWDSKKHSKTRGLVPEDISDEDWKTAKERYKIIEPFLIAKRAKRKEVEARGKEFEHHASTLYDWISDYKACDSIIGLLPRKRSGGRGRTRLGRKVEAIVRDTIQDFYLSKQQRSAKRIIEQIQIRCRNAKIKDIPHANTIRKRIRKLNPRLKTKMRHGEAAARAKYDPAVDSIPGADFPLAIVQIDHTPLPVIVVDEKTRQEIGRPYITVAIDVFSRAAMGFYLAFHAPNSISVGQCLVNSILRKEEWLKEIGVKGKWPVWGFPRSIHLDNAKEFHSKMLERACIQYNVDIHYRPVKRPEYGGNVERWIGTLCGEMKALPGATFSGPKEKGEYNSQKTASLTVRELERWIAEFFVNVYHLRVHEGIKTPPLKKWNEGIFGADGKGEPEYPTLPADEFQLRLAFMPSFERTMQRYGILLDKFCYFDDVLRPFINAMDGKVKRKFTVRRDSRDLSRIYFLDPELGTYYPIRCRRTDRPSMTIWEHKAATKFLKEQGRKDIDEEAIFAAREKMIEIAEEAKKKTKKVRKAFARSKSTLEAGRKQTAVLESLQTPTTNGCPKEDDPLDFDIDNVEPLEVEKW